MLQKIAEAKSTIPYPRVFWQGAFASSYRLAWGYTERACVLPTTLSSSQWFGCQGFETGQGWFFKPEEIREEAASAFSLTAAKPLPRIVQRIDTPSFGEWKKNVTVSLEQIEKGVLKKIVLARCTTLLLEEPVSPWDVLACLQEQHHPSTTLLVQRSPATAFIGATPEKLYERKALQLETMALAGTRRRSSGPQEDRRLREELFASEKEQREVAFVHQELSAALNGICQSVKADEKPSILETRGLYHLQYRLKGELRPDVGDRYLLQLLHPTPALGGAPRAQAIRLIKALEPIRRGWYGAPLGWFTKQEADVAIGIRSAMIQENKVHLYAGAGIVSGSTPEKEWDELESKIANFQKLWGQM